MWIMLSGLWLLDGVVDGYLPTRFAALLSEGPVRGFVWKKFT